MTNALVFLLSSLLLCNIVTASPTPIRNSLARSANLNKRAEPITFPIHRRSPSSGLSGAERRARDIAKIRAKHYSRGSDLGRRAQSETVAMSSFDEDNMYYSTIQIGTPPQSLDVQLDTGSSDLWLPVSGCRSCNTTQVQPELDDSEDLFQPERSSTYTATNQLANVPYGDGTQITGYVSNDTVSIGQFTVPQQTFIAAEMEEGEFDVAGLMGLAFPVLASSGGTPWWLNAISQFQSPEFSFYFADWASSASDDIAPGGQFTLGGRNTSLYTGDVSFVELTQQDYWTVPLTSILIPSTTGGNGQTLTASGDEATAIIDSGSTIITGPTDMVEAFYAAIPNAVKGETIDRTLEGSWVIPCDTNINAQFTFGSVTVTLPASVLKEAPINVTSRSSTTTQQVCLGALVSSSTLASGSSEGPAWIFGDSLLKGTYTVFRYGDPTTGEKSAVGFAKLAGVDYNGNGNEVIGSGGDGVDGRIGNAGVSAAVVPDTATETVGTGPATVTDTTTLTGGATASLRGRSGWMGVLMGVGALALIW